MLYIYFRRIHYIVGSITWIVSKKPRAVTMLSSLFAPHRLNSWLTKSRSLDNRIMPQKNKDSDIPFVEIRQRETNNKRTFQYLAGIP